MRLKAEQLPTHLQKPPLLPIYHVSGDEPLQRLESLDLIRRTARAEGINERTLLVVEKGFNWNRLQQASTSMSLFSARQLIELRLDNQKPGKEGAAALLDYTKNHAKENVLLISSAKLDKQAQKTKWFKALESIGAIIQLWEIKPAHLPRWISQRCRQYGKNIEQDAAHVIAQRVEGNLLAAKQEIDKLCLMISEPQISLQAALHAVTDNARFEVFDLIENACAGHLERARRMLLGLRHEGAEPIAIFAALMWEFRRINKVCNEIQQGAASEQVFGKYRIWQQRKALYKQLAHRLPRRTLCRMLSEAAYIDQSLKGAKAADSWQLLESFIFQLGGTALPTPAATPVLPT